MRFLKTALVVSAALAFAGSAWACNKDQSAKADQVKQQTASTQPAQPDQQPKKPHGG